MSHPTPRIDDPDAGLNFSERVSLLLIGVGTVALVALATSCLALALL